MTKKSSSAEHAQRATRSLSVLALLLALVMPSIVAGEEKSLTPKSAVIESEGSVTIQTELMALDQ